MCVEGRQEGEVVFFFRREIIDDGLIFAEGDVMPAVKS